METRSDGGAVMGSMKKTLEFLEGIADEIMESKSAIAEVVTNHKMGHSPFHRAYDELIEEFELDPDVAFHLLHPPLREDEWNREEE